MNNETNNESSPNNQPTELPTTQPDHHPLVAAAPVFAEQPAVIVKGRSNHAVEIVWQWVCYGLWEWALISLSVLLSVTFDYYFNNNSDTTVIVYSLAAMVCLLPLAFVANRFYSRTEPDKKEGFAAVVMVINAVGVFLATIGALITAVISTLSDFLNGSSADTNITIATALIVMVLGAMLFVRILRPAKLVRFVNLFPLIAVGLAGVAVVLAVAGPFRSGVASKNDRLIQDSLPTLSQDIQDYASNANSLPQTLNKIDFNSEGDTGSDSGQALVQRHLVTYQITDDSSANLDYNLCVNYSKAEGSAPYGSQDNTYIDTSSHPAGHFCYSQSAGDGYTQ